jgi:hypothetical protein
MSESCDVPNVGKGVIRTSVETAMNKAIKRLIFMDEFLYER